MACKRRNLQGQPGNPLPAHRRQAMDLGFPSSQSPALTLRLRGQSPLPTMADTLESERSNHIMTEPDQAGERPDTQESAERADIIRAARVVPFQDLWIATATELLDMSHWQRALRIFVLVYRLWPELPVPGTPHTLAHQTFAMVPGGSLHEREEIIMDAWMVQEEDVWDAIMWELDGMAHWQRGLRLYILLERLWRHLLPRD
jgi:hypothetical protein